MRFRATPGAAARALASVFILLAAWPAAAAVTLYDSLAAFQAAFPVSDQITFNSEPVNNQGYYGFPGATTSLGGDTFTANAYLNALDANQGYGSYGAIFLSAQTVGAANAVLQIRTPGLFAIGFDYGDYFFAPQTFTVTLSTGDQVVLPTAQTTAQFVGFASSDPITDLKIVSPASSYPAGAVLDVIDLYQVPSATSPTPEPADWILVLTGLALAGGAARESRVRSPGRAAG